MPRLRFARIPANEQEAQTIHRLVRTRRIPVDVILQAWMKGASGNDTAPRRLRDN